MITRMSFSELSAELTDEEKRELEEAEHMPPVFDEDCPEMTGETLKHYKKLTKSNGTNQMVSISVSSSTLKKAKEYGQGYSRFLGRLLDVAINDDELIRKCL